MGDYKMRDVSKTFQKSIAGQDASKMSKKSRCPKGLNSGTNRVEGKKLFNVPGSIGKSQKKIFEVPIRPPTPTPKKTPKGSEKQPRSDSHQNIPVPLPSKQEEVKPNRHLGDMSAVKKVPEKQRKVCVPKAMKEIRSMSPSNLTYPVTCCKNNDNGDVLMEDGTTEEEKVAKGQTRQGSPTKDIPKKTKNRSREHKKRRKNSNGDRRKMTQHLYRW
jgi:hypothetical protein